MSENIMCIGPVLGNPDTEMKLIFGEKVSAIKVLNFVEKSAKIREVAGFITNEEAIGMVKEAEEKLKEIKVA